MLALGAFRFGISQSGYQSLSSTAAYRWEKLERLGRAPALQFMGKDAEEITLEGVIYPHFKGGLRQMELMRLLAGTGLPQMLVDGSGFVFQRWCITSVEERKSVFLSDGAPRKIEFTISLQSYGSLI